MNGRKVEIRPVMPVDVGAIAALARAIWEDAYHGIISQEQIDYMLAQRYNGQRLLDELATPDIWWDLALVDGGLAAFVSTLRATQPGEMKLDKLYVDPAVQRLGLGGRLIEHVGERARQEGCHTLILAVNKRNERAIAAYAKNGFVVRESVRVDIGSGFVMDDFIMARPL